MTEWELYLHMAGCNWRISAPYELEIGDNYKPFLSQPCEADCEYAFVSGRPVLSKPTLQTPQLSVWRDPKGYFIERISVQYPKPCACIYTADADPLHVRGWVYPGMEAAFRTLTNLFDVGCMEYMISALDAINLHSSFVRWQGGAILFTAPSGTGKSTQAKLWEQYADAEQINGDRAVIRCVDGVWTAFGFPFAGSSGIFRNESVPIRAVVVLRQATENTIERLHPGEAFRLLYSETAIQRWHEKRHAAMIDQLILFSRKIPAYILRCTPDERAVRLLINTLSTEESI